MNTSYNKSRIIEHGWKNVLKNTFGLSSSLPNPYRNKENNMNENPTSNRVRKRRVPVYHHKRSWIYPLMTSRSRDRPSSSGCKSTLTVSTKNKNLNCEMEQKNECREIIIRPEGLKRPRQFNRALRNSIAIEMVGVMEEENVLGSTAKKIRKINCSKNGDLSITDLEQECDILFSCK